jgi:hypothetical protein
MPASSTEVNTLMENLVQYFEYDFRNLVVKLQTEEVPSKKIDTLLNEIGLQYGYRQKHKRIDLFIITDHKLFMIARLKYGI